MSNHIEKNAHFATMRRTPRETFAFALIALAATTLTTLLAVAPAAAGALPAVDSPHCADR